jgi:uncharacterized membrane protein YkoI
MKSAIKSILLAAAIGGVGVVAFAANKAGENDALAVANAKIPMAQAISVAEAKVQGKASKAEFEQQKGGKWVFDIEVVSGAKVYDVQVDAETGTVLAANEDHADRDDDHDARD